MIFSEAGLIFGIFGAIAPIIILISKFLIPPFNDINTKRLAARRAYRAFYFIGLATLAFNALIFGICYLFFDMAHDPEWVLGFSILFGAVGIPSYILLVVPVVFALCRSIKALRDLEFFILAIHSSLLFLVTLVLMERTGSVRLFYLFLIPTMISYPFVCLKLTWRQTTKNSHFD